MVPGCCALSPVLASIATPTGNAVQFCPRMISLQFVVGHLPAPKLPLKSKITVCGTPKRGLRQELCRLLCRFYCAGFWTPASREAPRTQAAGVQHRARSRGELGSGWAAGAMGISCPVQVFGRRQHERRLALRRPASKKRQGTKSREAWERLGGERYGDFRLAPSSLGGATPGRRCLDACTQGWTRE